MMSHIPINIFNNHQLMASITASIVPLTSPNSHKGLFILNLKMNKSFGALVSLFVKCRQLHSPPYLQIKL